MSEITRTEKFLRACIDGVPCALTPLTRVEKLLAELNETLAGPAPVVILPETELTYNEAEEGFILTSPWAAEIVAGGVYKATVDGVDYECEAYAHPGDGAPAGMAIMGNSVYLAQMGVTGGNPDAPFIIMSVPNEETAALGGAYGFLMVDTEAASVTLSIVQTEGASEDSGSGGGSGTCCITMEVDIAEGSNLTFVSKDKTYAEIKAAHNAGALPYCKIKYNVNGTLYAIVVAYCVGFPLDDSQAFIFRILYGLGQGYVFEVQADDTVKITLD